MYQTNYNIYGHQQNKCLDVHISKTFDDKEKIELSQLTEFSKSLRYEQKNKSPIEAAKVQRGRPQLI